MQTPHHTKENQDIHTINMNIMPATLEQLNNLINNNGQEYYTYHNNLTHDHPKNLWKNPHTWTISILIATLTTLTTTLIQYWTTTITHNHTNTKSITTNIIITLTTTLLYSTHILNKQSQKQHQQTKITTYKKQAQNLLQENQNINNLLTEYNNTNNPITKNTLQTKYYIEVEKHYKNNHKKQQDNIYYRQFQKELQQL